MKTKTINDEQQIIIERVLARLGDPIIFVEINNKELLNKLLKIATDEFNFLYLINGLTHDLIDDRDIKFKNYWVERFFSALCKESLARMRGKFTTFPTPEATFTSQYDANNLCNEAISEKAELKLNFKTYFGIK